MFVESGRTGTNFPKPMSDGRLAPAAFDASHMKVPAWFSAADQYALVSIGDCADALAVALHGEQLRKEWPFDQPRSSLRAGAGSGQLLVMPSTSMGHVGVKLVTVADPAVLAPGPRIQGVHIQFDAETLAPSAILDGTALTNLRTAAVSVLALRSLADPGSTELLVFGAGPQASSHVRGIAAEWPIRRVRLASRRPERARFLARELAGALDGVDVVALTADEVDGAVGDADVIVCATTAVTPIFAGQPRDGSAIVAVGSHSPAARELHSGLMRRAYVVVEDRRTALREAGDIVMAIADGALTAQEIDSDLAELVRGSAVVRDRPLVFKSVGMAWQDAVVADAILARAS